MLKTCSIKEIAKVLTEADVAAALHAAGGNISVAADALRMLRGDLDDIIKRRESLMKIVRDHREMIYEDAEVGLREAVDDHQGWAVVFVLKTLGKKRGYGKFIPRPDPPPQPEPSPIDMSRLNPDQLKRHQFLSAIAAGHPDGIMPPVPEFVKQLDERCDEVKNAFIDCRYNTRKVAEKLGVSFEQFQEYILRRTDLYEMLGDPHELLVDRAEAELKAGVAARKPWALTFSLKALGRTRGYHEDPRWDDPRDKPVAPDECVWSRLTLPQLDEMSELNDIVLGRETPWWKKWRKDVDAYEAAKAAGDPNAEQLRLKIRNIWDPEMTK